MHVYMEDFVKSFDEIRTSSLSHATCKLVIFVSCLDIDALCAAKLISSLLKTDLIPHKIVPVVGFEDLQASFKSAVADDVEIKNILCIGCGATVDLLDFLGISDEDDTNWTATKRKIYVIDNHRPWNLDNLFGSPNVVCFLDGYAEPENLNNLQDSYANYLRLMEEEEEEGDANETSQDEHDEDKNDDDDGAQTDEDDSVNSGEKRSRQDTPNEEDGSKKPRIKLRTRAEEIDRYKNTLESYYSQGSSLATSTSSLIYSLVSDLMTPTITHLWLTVVAATSLDNQHPHLYRLLFPTLKTEVLRLNPNANVPSTTTSLTNGHSGATNTGDDTSLFIETDYPFYLLRHWTLYDSMSHSSYVSAKLRLYTEDGRRRMHKMLAKMGISLHDARERWAHMNLTVKKVLPEKLASVASLYGIEDVIRQGIVRRFGYKGSISAGDCVDALLTLLQIGQRLKCGDGEHFNGFIEEDSHNGSSFMNGENSDPRDKFWIENFWTAWDALDNVNKLMQGIQLAKGLQQSIVLSATALLERRLIKDLRRFRLAVLKDGPELEVFSNPLALAQLAMWIAEASAEVSPRSLPLVVASLYPPTNTYLVVGIGPRKLRSRRDKKKKKKVIDGEEVTDKSLDDNEDDEDQDDDNDELAQYNEFGSAFHQIAEEIHAKVKVDAFESSVIEVAKDDLSRFLEALTLIGIKY